MKDALDLLVTYTCRPGRRAAFLERIAAEGIQAAVRREEGCLGYDYFLPAEDDGRTILLLERWTSREAADRHLDTLHMKRFAAFKGEYVAESRLRRLREV